MTTMQSNKYDSVNCSALVDYRELWELR